MQKILLLIASLFYFNFILAENEIKSWQGIHEINPEKPDVPLNKNDAFQKVQKRRVQEKR